ncbi:hypothetical protein MJK72_06125 [Klebsiella pneumoniae]|nr:hypothetical protein MJK72_06125 [Klebsiella pneumoniae]
MWDVEGREYLDFAGRYRGAQYRATSVSAAGCRRRRRPAEKKLSHTCFQVLACEPYLALCEKMNQKVPGDFAKKTLLVTTGS